MTREEHAAVEREDAERLKAMGLRATPNGIVPINEDEAGCQAANEELVKEELCSDLAGKFARKSAERTGKTIGAMRDLYEAIVEELRAVRYTQSDGKRYALATALRNKYETDEALQEFLRAITKWLDEYVAVFPEGCSEGTWAMYVRRMLL